MGDHDDCSVSEVLPDDALDRGIRGGVNADLMSALMMRRHVCGRVLGGKEGGRGEEDLRENKRQSDRKFQGLLACWLV